MERAYAPYSRYRVGVALRAPDGSVHVGANVENAAYPLGNCAEASAIGALIAAGRSPDRRGGRDRRRRGAVRPCGGCRQRLREFMPLDATVHLLAKGGPRDDDPRGAAAALLRPGVPAMTRDAHDIDPASPAARPRRT